MNDDQGRPLHTVAAVENITDRKRIEQQLFDSHLLLDTLLKNAPVGFAYLDKDLKFVTINNCLAEINGLSAAEHLGKTLREIVPALADDMETMIATIIETGEPLKNHEVRGETASAPGQVRVWSHSWYPVRDRDGVLCGFGVVVEEITERMHAEQMIRDSEARFRSLASTAPVGIFRTDAAGHWIYANDCVASLTGRSQEECLGDAWQTAVHPDDISAVVSDWTQTVSARAVFSREFRFVDQQGHVTWVIARAVPQNNDVPEHAVFVGTCTDITAAKQAKDALLEADRRKDEFLATLSHELRNPLSPVRTAAHLLKIKAAKSPEIKPVVDIIDRQVHAMTRLIDDLMDVSRINQGKIQLQLEDVDIARVVEAAIETSQPLISEMRHRLTVELPSGPLTLRVDSTRISQVLLNLLNNAAKYTERGGSIHLRAEHRDGHAVISVKDTGIGIPADKLSTLFEMFSQLENSLSKSKGGLGIGLCLVRQLVKLHGGWVEARSEGYGLGSEFLVGIPVLEPTSAHTALPEPDQAAEVRRQLKVLVVDDNKDAALTLAMVLKMTGHVTLTVHDGEAAVAAAQSERPDLILCDIGLPRLNGYEVCQHIRRTAWGKKIVLIAISGWGQEEARRKCFEAGFDHHLVKPVALDALSKVMTELLQRETEQTLVT